MLKLNPNQKRQPFGGHQFFDSQKAVSFRGNTFEDVKNKLTSYRINNGIPVGNPEQEILQYYATHWPFMVMPCETANANALSPKYLGWREFVSKSWLIPPKKFITSKEAQERWKICCECPFNQLKDWKETDESSELTRRAFVLRRGIDVPEYLGYCSLHRVDLGVFCFLDQAELPKKVEAPCWINSGA